METICQIQKQLACGQMRFFGLVKNCRAGNYTLWFSMFVDDSKGLYVNQ